jgi:hypothetical protein
MNEKGAVAIADSFSMAPRQYSKRVNNIVSLVTDDRDNLEKSFSDLRDLIHEAKTLIKI